LCCVAPAFARSADFAIDKPAGRPCPNLLADFRCGIHDRLRDKGFVGCTVYDCFGAGQHTVAAFDGASWRDSPDLARRMFDAFAVMRGLHELLWYVNQARALPAARVLRGELARAYSELEGLSGLGPDALVGVDVGPVRERVNELLVRTSEASRAPAGPDRRRADLVGAALRRADLCRADLRGALLIGADLRFADLRSADLIGADLRGASLAGADLTGALFLTQAQVDSARGDEATRLPAGLRRPAHW
jgi:hypothetical protein